MRILLVTPENKFIKAFRRRQHNNFVQLTVPYLAALVPPRHTVQHVDEYNQEIDFGERVPYFPKIAFGDGGSGEEGDHHFFR